MTQPGTVIVREGADILVELTDNINLKLTDESSDTHIFINFSDAEAWTLIQTVIDYLVKRGLIIPRKEIT